MTEANALSFILYADCKLQTPQLIARVAAALSRPVGTPNVRFDAHHHDR